jgi:hypothetical protein
MTREQFSAIRRSFRVASRISLLTNPDAMPLKMAAVTAMRTATGRWDLCEPLRYRQAFADWPHAKHGAWIARPIVTNTARRFFSRTF